MRRKKERPLAVPMNWEETANPPASKEDDRNVPTAKYFAGNNPAEFPHLGGKEGPTAGSNLPFPNCIRLADDPHKDNHSYFNDSMCLNFISNLHQLLLDQGRLQDMIKILAGLQEKASGRDVNPISESTFKKSLGISTNQWAISKFGSTCSRVDSVTIQRLFAIFKAVYNFTGETNDIMRRICGPTQKYQPWYKKTLLPCLLEDCPATFETNSDLLRHQCLNHPNSSNPATAKSGRDNGGTLKFKCLVCDKTILHVEKEICDHLKSHHLSMARYAFTKLTNVQNIFETPHPDYWTQLEENDLFENIKNFPNSSAPLPDTTTPPKAPAKPSSASVPTPSQGNHNLAGTSTHPSTLNDFLAPTTAEPMDQGYEHEQEFQRLLNNPPISPLSGSDTFGSPAASTTPSPPTKGAHDTEQCFWNNTSLASVQGPGHLNPAFTGPPSTSGQPLAAPFPADSSFFIPSTHLPVTALGTGPTANFNSSTTTSFPTTNFVPVHGPQHGSLNLVGPAATQPGYPSFQLIQAPVSSVTPPSTAAQTFLINSDQVVSMGPAVPNSLPYSQTCVAMRTNSMLPLASTNFAPVPPTQWAWINGIVTQIPASHLPNDITLANHTPLVPSTTCAYTPQIMASHPSFMTYNVITPNGHPQGTNQPVFITPTTAQTVPSQPTSTGEMMTTTTDIPPMLAVNPLKSNQAEASQHADKPHANIVDPAIIKMSSHFTKPTDNSIQDISHKSNPKPSTRAINHFPKTPPARRPIKFANKEDDVLSSV